jgi:AraC-like DNA-binding protein
VNLDQDELRSYDADGRALIERSRGAILGAPSRAPIAIDPGAQRRIVGVAFRPGGTWPLLRSPVDAFAGAPAELGDVWGRAGEVVRERLLAAAEPDRRAGTDVDVDAALTELGRVLLEQVARPLAADRAVGLALRAFEHGASVAAVVEATGLAERTLLRRFRDRVGLSPKRYARVRRFQRALAVAGAAAEVDWARVALDLGFADQAHLIHEFRAFAGMSPTAYRPVAGMRNHVEL